MIGPWLPRPSGRRARDESTNAVFHSHGHEARLEWVETDAVSRDTEVPNRFNINI